MGKRTSPFAHLVPSPAVDQGSDLVPEEPTEAIPQALQHKPSRAKRNREWERQQMRVTYRGIPTTLHERLKELAVELSVPVGDIVRAFLEHGLDAYEQGDLTLQPHLRIGKMTLYPGEQK